MTTAQLEMLRSPATAGKLKLRPYQIASVDELRDGLRQGFDRQMLCAPTGAGKTEIAAYLIEEARRKRSRVAFLADTINLVDQASRRLTKYGIPHGVAQGDNTHGRYEHIQVCSIQTVQKRGYWPDLDILIIDEAHIRHQPIMDFALAWGGPTIGLSATPTTKGLGEFYERVVNAVTTDWLLENVDANTGGTYLVPLRIKPIVQHEIDMSGAPKVNGEFKRKDIRERSRPIIGDIVSTWVKLTHDYFGGPVKTLLFTADTQHGEELCAAFQATGHDFRQSTYRDSGDDTREIVAGHTTGEFIGLASVDKFSKGHDDPTVMCIIDARPNGGSLAALLQKMGRGSRPSPGKEFCLYIDHAGNATGWYHEIYEFWANGVDSLDDGKKATQTRREDKERNEVLCRCGFVVPPGVSHCDRCGWVRKQRSSVEVVPGRIGEELTAPGSRRWNEDKRWTWEQICRVASHIKRYEPEGAQKLARRQYQVLYGEWPQRDFQPSHEQPDSRVERKVRRQLRDYFGRRNR